MTGFNQDIHQDMQAIVREWVSGSYLREGDIFVIGCSTSEITGENIGTSGSQEVAAVVFNELKQLQQHTGIQLVFQCCEHLNRCIVMERETMQASKLEEVSVIPVPGAGGSMATYAYNHIEDPVVVENVEASAGIDIGETMIGMHLKQVAVPLHFEQRWVGNARIRAARTRPKLIGGKRANYETTKTNDSCETE
ncbi:uncharacterized protein (TIGR01440 family) [Virgibacillus natechei]|uniref:UPF0340 protein J2Z83_001973 n=1 Tax=Virgibacillus natechei TaxID=1216297 RepID=A0ABS4IFZ2_9BACI|nr:TIGR01440 family protein [Virgibacillus natechei]MBP1969865.1 uncharacterized protein (TIGR01440 family) [Virgibacillus natechei]UZD12605.1 TIGR01440 family protein [Virgibacillus natechei]